MQLEDYATGTVSISNGSTALTGSGTAWSVADLKEGDTFYKDGYAILIASVDSDTGITLADAWPGATLSGAAYVIRYQPDNSRMQGTTRQLLDVLRQGIWLTPDATGKTADKATYDARPAGFRFLDVSVDPFKLYVKESDTSGDWSAGADWVGPKGDAGSSDVVGTSATSLAIATGSKTFTITEVKRGWGVGARLRASSDANGANWMEGIVTSYASDSLALSVDLVGGSGTFADWTINLAGSPGDISSATTDASSFGFVVADGTTPADPSKVLPTAAWASDSANQNFLRSETGAVSKSVFSILKQRIRPTDFGADPAAAGSVNRAAINNAVNAAGANGALVELPAGVFDIDGTVLPLAANVTFAGQGEATTLRTTSATANIIDVAAAFVKIRDIQMASSVARTAGSFVNVQATANRFELQDFHMTGAWQGVTIADGVATVHVKDGKIFNTVATTGIPIKVSGGLDVLLKNLLADGAAGSQPFAGIFVENAGDVTIDTCRMLHAGIGLDLNPAAGQVITSIWAVNSSFDNNGNMAMQGFANGGTIARCKFDSCWFSSSTNQGIRLRTALGGLIDGMDFINPHIFLNGGDGAVLEDSGVVNVSFDDPAICQNTGDGLKFASGATKFRVVGGKSGSGYGLSGNGGYGINLAGSNDNFSIDGTHLSGNTSGAVNLNSQALSTTKRIKGCVGFATESDIVIAGTTNASGDLTANHNLGTTPTRAVATAYGGTFEHAQITSLTSTQVTVRVFDAAGAALASTAITGIYVHLVV